MTPPKVKPHLELCPFSTEDCIHELVGVTSWRRDSWPLGARGTMISKKANKETLFSIKCSCGASGPTAKTAKEARRLWNMEEE